MVCLKASHVLQSKVIDRGLCTLCGGCLGRCPYFAAHEGRVVVTDACDLAEGYCSMVCPRLELDLDHMSKEIFGAPYAWDELGTIQQIFMARSTDPSIRLRAQNAGTVTSLIGFALDQGLIDSAILTSFNNRQWPRGTIARNKDEVLKCIGSSYMAAPTVEAFNRATCDGGPGSLGVVGTPCQVVALRRMRTAPTEICKNGDRLRLVIGLFCTWALSYPGFAQFIEKKVAGPVVKCDVPPHPADAFVVYTEKGRMDIPLDEVLPFVMPSCHLCSDLTAEFADVSVGGGRGEVLDWNTVVVRTQTGMSLVEAAVQKGIIETTEIPEGNLGRLKAAGLNKKKRAFSKILEKTGSVEDLLYLQTERERVKHLLEDAKGGGLEDA